MADRAELVEAALDVYPEGLALLDHVGRVVYWNRAAELITGRCGASVVGRELPQPLEPLMSCGVFERIQPLEEFFQSQDGKRGTLVHAQHQHGHDVPAIARKVLLRDPLGARIGVALVFHVAERAAPLPHGETREGSEVRASVAEERERLELAFEQFVQGAQPLGLLWIRVDQAEDMRKTHGERACEAMIENMDRMLANHQRAGNEIGRWGDDEFLVISQEGSGEALGNYGQILAGIARTADFRWWGDRLTLTVSIGAAPAEEGETLEELLGRARGAMGTSAQAGGNRVTLAPRRLVCSPS